MSAPYISSQVLAEVVREASYGKDPGGSPQFPLYGGVFVPVAEMEVLGTNRAQSGADAPLGRVVGDVWKFGLQVPVAGADDPAEPPVWTRILEAGGLDKDHGQSGASRTIWRFDQKEPSITWRFFRGGRRYVATGCRASFEITADAGQPGSCSAQVSGLYNASVPMPLPTDTLGRQPVPESLCAANFILTAKRDAVVRSPILKGFALSVDNQLLVVSGAKRDKSIMGFRFAERSVRFRCRIEDDGLVDWSDLCRTNERFDFSLTLGQSVGQRFTFSNPTPWTVGLQQAPAPSEDPAGLLVWDLVFTLGGKKDNSLEVKHH